MNTKQLRERHSFTTAQGAHVVFRPEEALETLVELFEQKDRILITPPQKQLPSTIEHGTREHANYLFFLTSNDYRVRSRDLYNSLRNASETAPGLTEPGILAEMSLDEAISWFTEHNVFLAPNYKYERVKRNADLLAKKYDSDIRTVEQHARRDALEAQKLVREFEGMGLGTSNLFLGYSISEGICSFDNDHELSVKVDTHKIRFPFQMGWFSTDHKSPWEIHYSREKLAEHLSKTYRELLVVTAQEIGEKYWTVRETIDEAIWSLGETTCAKRDIGLCEQTCPLEKGCQGRPHVNSSSRLRQRSKPKERWTSTLVTSQGAPLVGKCFGTPQRREIYFTDRKSGNSLLSLQDEVYLFVDIRKGVSKNDPRQESILF